MAGRHDPEDMLVNRIPAVGTAAVENHLVVWVYFDTDLPSLVVERGLKLVADS